MRTKTISIIIVITMLLGLLSGCRYVDTSPKISLYSDHSLLIGADYRSLPNYRLSTAGDVPYVELNEYLSAVYDGFGETSVYTRGDGVFSIMRDNVNCIEIDVNTDTMTLKRFDYLICGYQGLNNGYGVDRLMRSNTGVEPVHGSEKTKILTERNIAVIDGKRYGFNFVEQDGKLYFPFQVVNSLFHSPFFVDVAYNGIDFYYTGEISVDDRNEFGKTGYCFDEGKFFFCGVILYPAETSEGEAYRFIHRYDDYNDYLVLALYDDGTGNGFYTFNADDTFDQRETDFAYRMINWRQEPSGVYMDIDRYEKDGTFDKNEGEYRVTFDKGYPGEKRSRSLIEYNYNFLRYLFENFYGLKDEKIKGDFDALVKELNLKEGLLSEDADTYDRAFSSFLINYLDDGHTSIKLCSAFNEMDTVFADGKYSYNDDQGILILTDNSRRYHDLRKEMMVEKYGYDENDNMQGLFIDGETAVVRFDSFITNMLDDQLYIYTENSIPYLFDYSTNVGFDNCFYWIYTTHPEIKNVVIDLSCNGGGSVNAVPYVAAFFTGDPYFYNVDALTGNAFEWHYEIDFNRDGTFNRNWDSFENYYNFYLLVSDVSASSSNRLAAFAKNAGVKIIGKRDFGGGCGMVTYADACGFVFNASEARLCLYKDNDGNLVSSDHGVPVDYELDPEYWYDFEKLNAFLASLNA